MCQFLVTFMFFLMRNLSFEFFPLNRFSLILFSCDFFFFFCLQFSQVWLECVLVTFGVFILSGAHFTHWICRCICCQIWEVFAHDFFAHFSSLPCFSSPSRTQHCLVICASPAGSCHSALCSYLLMHFIMAALESVFDDCNLCRLRIGMYWLSFFIVWDLPGSWNNEWFH